MEKAQDILTEHLKRIYSDGNPEYVKKVYAEIDRYKIHFQFFWTEGGKECRDTNNAFWMLPFLASKQL